MNEFGIFNDEGCLEAGFYSLEKAKAVIAEHYSDEPGVMAVLVCPQHSEQIKDFCDECKAEEEDE